jgi:hypothetical protein
MLLAFELANQEQQPPPAMTLRRSEFYAPLATLFLALVALISTTAALEQASDSLEKIGQKYTDSHKFPVANAPLMLAGLSQR